MKTCSICFYELKATFIQFNRNDFKVLFFCKKKCRKNYNLGKKLKMHCYAVHNIFNIIYYRTNKWNNNKKIKKKKYKMIFIKEYLIKHSKLIILKNLVRNNIKSPNFFNSV
uniref:C2H2-type domain-containing protein n=1 Tax=Lotharella vacuolata TaxID=74820 RepID=A0A0H5BH36_9EUKA|nr:hypothetical protein [Lotharella vacuolata]